MKSSGRGGWLARTCQLEVGVRCLEVGSVVDEARSLDVVR
jgi:hypothetical protein